MSCDPHVRPKGLYLGLIQCSKGRFGSNYGQIECKTGHIWPKLRTIWSKSVNKKWKLVTFCHPSCGPKVKTANFCSHWKWKTANFFISFLTNSHNHSKRRNERKEFFLLFYWPLNTAIKWCCWPLGHKPHALHALALALATWPLRPKGLWHAPLGLKALVWPTAMAKHWCAIRCHTAP